METSTTIRQPEGEIISIVQLLKKELSIPYYQRPYKWERKHVRTLLEDIGKECDKETVEKYRYRLGTIIVHKNKENNTSLDIVDGQQRLTTLAILLHQLGVKNTLLSNQTYEHRISIRNIRANHGEIESFFKEYKDTFKSFLLHKCEVVYMELDNIEEAFQFFDSQNSKGKELEGYDLLKAYHLREMDTSISNREKKNLVEEWERWEKEKNKNDTPILSVTFNHLYALREWLRHETTSRRNAWSTDFIKEDVDHFKGVNISSCHYPYIQKISNPHLAHQLDREILNGEIFFKYILHYAQMYKVLEEHYLVNNKFDDKVVYEQKRKEEGRIELKNIYKKPGTRYRYTTLLFERVSMLYIDKFGENFFDQNRIIELFKWACGLLDSPRVTYSAVQSLALDTQGKLLKIKYSTHHSLKI